LTTRRWWNAIQCFTPLLPRQGWLVRTVSLVRVRWALGTLRPRWATLLAALIDDEEVMEGSEGWRRDVKTVLKCSPSVVREHIAELLIDLEMGCSTLWRPRFASIMCWGGAGTSKYLDIAGQDDFSSDTDEGTDQAGQVSFWWRT